MNVSKRKPRTLYVVAVPSDDSNRVRLIGDENGKPFITLRKAEAAGQSMTVFANNSFVLPVIPWNEGCNEIRQAMSTGQSSVDRENAKGLRFLRTVTFPRFTMHAGEIWESGFDAAHALGSTARGYYAAIDSGDDRFEFAGGVCLVKDVELLLLSAEEIERRKEIDAAIAEVRRG